MKASILVVDDEEDIQELIRYNFGREGYAVTCVDSGEAALEEIAKQVPGLILLDVMLPGVDGLEVCRQLKRSERTVNIPVIIITARVRTRTSSAVWNAAPMTML